VVDSGEQCDDGNSDEGDGCFNCLFEGCGNKRLDTGEQCDDGNVVTEECPYGQTFCAVCDDSCTLIVVVGAFCGDGRANIGNGEECDEGENNGAPGGSCDAACHLVLPE
jgi:hypothetical protein